MCRVATMRRQQVSGWDKCLTLKEDRMPAVRKLPPAHVLRQLRLKGMKLKEIAAEYDVTEPAVWRAMDRAGLIEHRETFNDFLPWKVAPEHKTTATMERLRTLLKQRNGAPTTLTEERLLRQWLEGLEKHHLVLNYHPEAPANAASSKGGFYYSTRVPTDDGIFRIPK